MSSETPRKRFKLSLPPQIKDLKDLIRISNTGLFYKHLDTIALWRIQPHLEKLDSMIGMENVKKSIFRQIVYYIQGMHTRDVNGEYLHTRIVGPPGTGKTTIAHIISDIYKDIGILKGDGEVNLVHRDDFVAGYVGQTAIKTKKLLTKCIGGVLFYDEGYSMGSNRDDDSFAKEAVDTLTSFLSEHKTDFCFIIAGYEEDIDKYFFSINKGLARRIPWCHKIEKYTSDNLAFIVLKMIKDINWFTIVIHKDISELISQNMDLFSNSGGDIENFISKSKICHANRVFSLCPEIKFILTHEDFTEAIELIKQNQQNKEDSKYISMYS